MKQEFFDLKINTNGQKLYEFTDQVIDWIKKKKPEIIICIGSEEAAKQTNRVFST